MGMSDKGEIQNMQCCGASRNVVGNHWFKHHSLLNIVADHVHPFLPTVYPFSDGYFQQDNAPGHKTQITSNWFHEHDNEFTILKWHRVT